MEGDSVFDSLCLSVGVLINTALSDKQFDFRDRASKEILLFFWSKNYAELNISLSCNTLCILQSRLLVALVLSLAYQSALLASLVKSREAQVAETFAEILSKGVRINLREGSSFVR